MTTIDFVSVGVIAVFDQDSGEVLHVHEKIVEVTDGAYKCGSEISEDERRELQEKIAAQHSDRRIDSVIAGAEFGHALGRPVNYRVEPGSRSLHADPLDTTAEIPVNR